MTRTALYAALFAFPFLAHAAPAAAAPCGTENLLAGKAPQDAVETTGNLALLTDGAVGAEGGQWDAPVVAKLNTPAASVTYDLGAPTEISALLMQGDANDVYQVSGSLDGTAGSFAPLTEFPNAVGTGHGLRTRTVVIPPAKVRYLRLGGATGDGFFSISELAVYCQKPSPFPPVMRVVTAAPQQSPSSSPRNDGLAFFQLLYTAAALGLAWLAYRFKTEPKRPTGTDTRSSGSP